MFLDHQKTPDAHLYEVWLNGARDPLAIRADEQLCFVERYAKQPDGDLRMDALTGKTLIEREYGRVEIRRVNQQPFRDPRHKSQANLVEQALDLPNSPARRCPRTFAPYLR